MHRINKKFRSYFISRVTYMPDFIISANTYNHIIMFQELNLMRQIRSFLGNWLLLFFWSLFGHLITLCPMYFFTVNLIAKHDICIMFL